MKSIAFASVMLWVFGWTVMPALAGDESCDLDDRVKYLQLPEFAERVRQSREIKVIPAMRPLASACRNVISSGVAIRAYSISRARLGHFGEAKTWYSPMKRKNVEYPLDDIHRYEKAFIEDHCADAVPGKG